MLAASAEKLSEAMGWLSNTYSSSYNRCPAGNFVRLPACLSRKSEI